MGLDCFVFKTKTKINDPVDFLYTGETELAFEWRKHYALHRLMTQIYEESGGKHEDFNSATLLITWDIIAKIEDWLGSPEDKGHSNLNPALKDWMFLARASRLMANGWTLFYSASH